MKVEQVMTRDVATARPGDTLKQAARVLVERGISGLPVVDERGQVVGVVSEGDVLTKEVGELVSRHPLAWLTGQADGGQAKLDARLVGEAMTTPAITIEAQRSLNVAAKLMVEKGVNRLPVVAEGKLVGLVTRADLVRAFVRADEEIAQEIRDDVVVRSMWLDQRSIDVAVADGEVTLTGTVDTRAEAKMLAALVARVPGVTGVHADLAWAEEG